MDSPRLVADRIDELPDPAESVKLIGHDAEFDKLVEQFNSGRMHHAWLISGPKGIGKATLAYHFASHVLSATGDGEARSTEAAVDSRISAGGHANLLYISRPWDEKAKRFKTQITVDEVRRVSDFFNKTAAEKSWRVCLVDAVDDMNRNAANALLKTLEEPPIRTLFLLVSHSPGRLLPTIRSRCQHLSLNALNETQITEILGQVIGPGLPANDQLASAANLAKGSARRAINLLLRDGLELENNFRKICENLNAPNWTAIHALAGKIAPKTQQERFDLFLEMAFDYMAKRATDPGQAQKKHLAELAGWTEVWEKTAASVRQADSYNLDKKQVILSMFQSMHEAESA